MKKQIEIYKKLHGKHTCQHPGCRTIVLGSYCLEHLEAAVAKQWEEINETGKAEKPSQPTGE